MACFSPRISDFKSGSYAQYELTVKLENYKANEISVIVKNDDKLVIDARYNENHHKYGMQKNYFYKQVTLPTDIDLSQMHCRFNQAKGLLVVFIPIMKILEPGWSVIPIQFECNSKTLYQNTSEM